jgi:bacteriorhodopsin
MSDDSADDFRRAGAVTQTFSALGFAGLFVWLVLTNGKNLNGLRKESDSKRLEFAVNICIYVALISACCNLFQLTEVDDQILPRQRGFVVDMARPIEWMLTCPFLQLGLVMIGGEKIPAYRMALMPLLALLILTSGFMTVLFAELAFVWGFFALGSIAFGIMVYFNGKQIQEVNEGEGFLAGESPFRTATLVLIVTWLPFPLWFALSPEGTGLIQDAMMIQAGWAFFNLMAKFVLITYFQRMKDLHITKEVIKHEMVSVVCKEGGDEQRKQAWADDKQYELLAIMNKMQEFSARAEEKIDAFHEVIDRATCNIVHEHGHQLAAVKQQLEVGQSAQIQHQSNMLDSFASDLAYIREALNEMKDDTHRESLREDLKENSSEIIRAVCDIQDKSTQNSDYLTSVMKEHIGGIKESMNEQRLTWNMLVEGMLSRVSKIIDDQTSSISNCVQTASADISNGIQKTSNETGDHLQKNMRGLEDQLQSSFKASVDFLDSRLRNTTDALAQSVKESSEKATTQFSHTSSSLSQANAVAIKEHMTSFHQAQLTQYGMMEEKLGHQIEGMVAKASELTVHKIFEVTEKQGHTNQRLLDSTSEVLQTLRTVPDMVVRSSEMVSDVVKSQVTGVREALTEQRGSLNFVMEGMLTKFSKNLDDHTHTVNTGIHATSSEIVNGMMKSNEALYGEIHKSLQQLQDQLQLHLGVSVEQLHTRLASTKEQLEQTVKEHTERATTQISHTNSALSQANAVALKEQMANFHEAQIQNQGNLERKLGSQIDSTVAKVPNMTAAKILDVDLATSYSSRRPSTATARRIS